MSHPPILPAPRRGRTLVIRVLLVGLPLLIVVAAVVMGVYIVQNDHNVGGTRPGPAPTATP